MYLKFAGLTGSIIFVFLNMLFPAIIFCCQKNKSNSIKSYNNVYLTKSLVFNRPVFKTKTQVNYEGHHNEGSQYNTSHRGIALGEPRILVNSILK